MQKKLHQLDPTLKHFLAAFTLLLSIATSVGLTFVYQTTRMQLSGVIERYNGSDLETLDETIDIPENYPKSISELLLNTHNHLFGFSFIFLSMGILFFFNSFIDGKWKSILLVEPFISVFITFASMWGMRFIDPAFAYVLVLAAVLTYLSFFVMAAVIVYELLFYKTS